MVKENPSKGISDITSSEGKLKRFSQICKLITLSGAMKQTELIQLIKAQMKLTNEKVIGRHINIMEKLGILKKLEGGGYLISGKGKALVDLVGDIGMQEKQLTLAEKIFYFQRLFINASSQLFLFLETINKKGGMPRDRIVVSYFTEVLARRLKIWKEDTLKIFLRKSKRNRMVPRSLENRFTCMEMWLRDLELLTKIPLRDQPRNSTLYLTEIGKSVFQEQPNLEKGMFGFCSVFVGQKPYSLPRFNFYEDQNVFINLFKVAYLKFERAELRLADVEAIRLWICINLLIKHSIIMEEEDFNSSINLLVKKRLIRSVISGRDGTPAYFSR
jgi:hypothetical protein